MARKARLMRVLTLNAKFVGTSTVSIAVFDETSGETFVHLWEFRGARKALDKNLDATLEDAEDEGE